MRRLSSALIAVLLIAAMLVGLGAAAYADNASASLIQPEYTGNVEGVEDVFPTADCLLVRTDDGYVMVDYAGNALTGAYACMTDVGGGFVKVETKKDLLCGVLDSDGNVIVPAKYSNLEVIGPFAFTSDPNPADRADRTVDAGLDKEDDTIYWVYGTTSVISLKDGKTKLEVSSDDYDFLWWDGATFKVADKEWNFTIYDEDFRELDDDAVAGIYETDPDSIVTPWDIVPMSDDLDFLESDGNYCVNGFYAATCGNVLSFYTEDGTETAEFTGLNLGYGCAFFGDSAAVYDAAGNAGTICHADGTVTRIDREYTEVCDCGPVCGSYYLTACGADGRVHLLDTEGHDLASGKNIYLTEKGHAVFYDPASGEYRVYDLSSEITQSAAASAAGSTGTGTDYVSAAEAQGITIPTEFAAYSGSDNMFTFYSTDCDNGINMKSKPENGRADRIGTVSLPFNGRLIGTCGSWDLVEDYSGKYFYIYEPIIGRIAISENTAESDYSAILTLAASSGTTAPDGFTVQKGVCGQMINDKGTETYALYKFHNPNDADHYGLFYIVNTSNSSTTNNNSWVTIYGYYNNKALVWHQGEFFWVSTTFFKAG